MKRIWYSFVAVLLIITLTACSGNYSQVDLNEPIEISEEGIVEKNILEDIKADNAIATFVGTSSDIRYEWTIFGSDLTETKDINLALDLEVTDVGIKIDFREKEDLGFPALLSIHLNEKWKAESATAYEGETPIYSVSITGSKTSILNIPINDMAEICTVIPDENKYTESVPVQKQESVSDEYVATEPTPGNKEDILLADKGEDYLSAVKNEDNKVYTGFTQGGTQESISVHQKDDYLSDVKQGDNRVYSDGSATGQDKYQTDPVPEGKPMPIEPENQEINKQKAYTCTFSIECATILNNLSELDPDKRELVPSNGVILAPITVTFYEGESVYDVLLRVCKENNIHMESSWTPIYNSAYIEGIHNLYEFDCGALSGWMYRVNGWYPNYGCSRYQLTNGEYVEWRYTCDLGKDVGCDWMQ